MQKKVGFNLLIIVLAVFILSSAGFASDIMRAAKVVSLDGDVKIKKAGGEREFNAFKGMSLTQGDSIITGNDAWVKIMLDEDTEIKLSENTYINLNELIKSEQDDKEKTSIYLWSGKIWNNVKKSLNVDSKYEIKTPTAVMGVRGTKFYVGYKIEKDDKEKNKSGKMEIVVMEGKVAAKTEKTVQDEDGSEKEEEKEIVIDKNQSFTMESKLEPKIEEVTSEKLDLFILETIAEDDEGIDEKLLENIEELIKEKREEEKEEELLEEEFIEEQLRSQEENKPEIIFDEKIKEKIKDKKDKKDRKPADYYDLFLENTIVTVNEEEIEIKTMTGEDETEITIMEAVVPEGNNSISFTVKNKYGNILHNKEIVLKNENENILINTANQEIYLNKGVYLIFIENQLVGKIYCVEDNYGILRICGFSGDNEILSSELNMQILDSDSCDTYNIQYDANIPLMQSIALPASNNYQLFINYSLVNDNIILEPYDIKDVVIEFPIYSPILNE